MYHTQFLKEWGGEKKKKKKHHRERWAMINQREILVDISWNTPFVFPSLTWGISQMQIDMYKFGSWSGAILCQQEDL